MEPTALYQISELEFAYPDVADQERENQFRLGPLNLNIASGRLTAILGRSGSGKTTLLSILGLLRKHLTGDFHIQLATGATNGTELWQTERSLEAFRANNIGYALQKGELLPFLSLYDNAKLVLKFLQQSDADIAEKLTPKFEALYQEEARIGQLSKVMHSKPSQVSQGQYQRGAIVRALANNPHIVLADEPTGNLDQHAAQQAMHIFRELVRSGRSNGQAQSVVVVTHDLKLAIEYADDIVVMSNGQCVAHYTQELDAGTWHGENTPAMDQQQLEQQLLEIL